MYKYLKRLLDIILSIILLIVFFIPILLISILIIIVDQNHPFFIQTRTGFLGKKFNIYKLQTMKNDKITKLGKILRECSIDELPQLINILKGDMSFVGPRAWIVAYYNNMNKYQKRRYEVLPGLTGLAQVNGRNNLSILEKISLDIYYVDNYSFILDFKIILKTILVIFNNKDIGTGTGISHEIKVLKKHKGDRNEKKQ